MESADQQLPVNLLDLLRNTLVLKHVSPLLDITDLLSLAATSKSFRVLIFDTPQVFQRIDLSAVSALLRRKGALPYFDVEYENPSTDEFFARPLRDAFRSLQKHKVLQDIRTLILDGCAVPAIVVTDILCDDSFNVRILSLRGVRELGDAKLIQILRYIIRPSRPKGTPKLKGLYYFTPIQYSTDNAIRNLQHRQRQIGGITDALGAQLGAGLSSSGSSYRNLMQSTWQSHPWYSGSGEVLSMKQPFGDQWVNLMQACEGLIAFDMVLCCHSSKNIDRDSSDIPYVNRRMVSISLDGCQKCGSCPEGPAYPGISPETRLPMLTPPPFQSSSVKAAQRLDTDGYPHPPFIARCRFCLKDRWCERCNVWWCESCYTVPNKRGLTKAMADVSISPKDAESIKVHNNLCVSKCLMDEMLNGVGEGGMWG